MIGGRLDQFGHCTARILTFATVALRNPWYLLCGLLLTAFFPLPTRLHSQTPAAKLLQDIRSATDETNVPQKLHDLWQLDSNLTYLVAAEVHGYYERQVPARTRAQADTLLRIYAIARPDIAHALERIYASVAQEITARAPACWASGRCCNFAKAGHRLYVTGLEAAYALHHRALTPAPAPTPACARRRRSLR